MLQYYSWTIIIVLIIIIFFLSKYLFDWFGKNKYLKFLKWFDVSAYSVVALFLYLFNMFFWALPVVNPYIVDIPVVKGRYEGQVYIRHDNDSIKIDTAKVVVDIFQTATNCDMVLKSKEGSISKSLTFGFEKRGGVWSLYTVYHNENLLKPMNRNEYYGACIVDVDSGYGRGLTLRGKWFNDVTRKTYGTIIITRIQ